ncbi:MAG: response regulator [Patescibacteria group bacterium]
MKKKILIVEDEPSLRSALRDKIKDQGFEVFTGANGKEGLKQAIKNKPDLILLDIIMPKVDGVTMLKKLREESKWGKEVPVVILTNLGADDEIVKDCLETKPVYYLIKSEVSLEEVIERIKMYLKM